MFKFKKKNNLSGVISNRVEDKSSDILSKYKNPFVIWGFVVILIFVVIYFVLAEWRDASAVNIENVLDEQSRALFKVTNNDMYYSVVDLRRKTEGLKYISNNYRQSFFTDNSPLVVVNNFSQTLHKGVKIESIEIDFDTGTAEEPTSSHYDVEVRVIAQSFGGKSFVQVVGEQELIWQGEDESGGYDNFPWLTLEDFNTNYEVEEEGIAISASFRIDIARFEDFVDSQSESVQSDVLNNPRNPYVFYEDINKNNIGGSQRLNFDLPPAPDLRI